MAMPIAVGMLVQTLYFLIDLYFVSRLGDTAIAGVSLAGNVMFLVFALSQSFSTRTSTSSIEWSTEPGVCPHNGGGARPVTGHALPPPPGRARLVGRSASTYIFGAGTPG
jgi:hypothetical protein